MFFSQRPAHLLRADELKQEPPAGTAYSVPLPGTAQPSRTPVYRAWNAQTELLKTLDPNVRPLFNRRATMSMGEGANGADSFLVDLGPNCTRHVRVDRQSPTQVVLSRVARV